MIGLCNSDKNVDNQVILAAEVGGGFPQLWISLCFPNIVENTDFFEKFTKSRILIRMKLFFGFDLRIVYILRIYLIFLVILKFTGCIKNFRHP